MENNPGFMQKDLLETKSLSKKEITNILDTAESFIEISSREIKKVPTLRGRTIINLFFEPSTRTRTSFEIAGKRLSADVINISGSTSSTAKGENLLDTAQNLEAMHPDIIVVRHSVSGVPHWIASQVKCSVINAGDGAHEHPTQALLDMMTLRHKLGNLDGLKIAITGDVVHSRVARSNIHLMLRMGMEVMVVGPPTMIPLEIKSLGVAVFHSLDEVMPLIDVIMILRVQFERQNQNTLPSIREYSKLYCLTQEKLDLAKKKIWIMHPGPVNRGIEISQDILQSSQSLILNQVSNGVALRMALLYLLSGGSHETAH